MPLVITFDGLDPAAHTWYQDLDTGEIVQAYPGSVHPVRAVNDVQRYVTMGLGTISGVEDGTDGIIDELTNRMIEVFIDLQPLEDPSYWTLATMLERIGVLQDLDEEALADYQEAQRPHVSSTVPVDDSTDVAIATDVVVIFDKAMDPTTMIPANFIVRKTEGEGNPNLVDSVIMSGGNTTATLILSEPLEHALRYIIEITTDARTADSIPFQTQYAMAHGWVTIAGDGIAPEVVAFSPLNLATDVALDVEPTITFSEAMDPATMIGLNIVLLDPVDGAVAASITMDVTNTIATITPDDPLLPNTVYRIGVNGTADGGTTADATGDLMVTTDIQADGFTTVAA